MTTLPHKLTKHQLIRDFIHTRITEAYYLPGQRIPSETELCERFQTTRATVGKALQELALAGLITRRRGSGSCVALPVTQTLHTFGLLIPNLGETEIFEPICNALAVSVAEHNHRLFWGQFATRNMEERSLAAERLCGQYIEQGVDGVFFAPIEQASAMDETNARITQSLELAGIPVVLFDCDFVKFPERSQFDVIGIDNRRAGYLLAQHLIAQGCRRIAFVCRLLSAQTIEARIAGYREALLQHGLPVPAVWVHRGEPTDADFIARLLAAEPPDAIICGNDYTAALLVDALLRRGVRVPDDIRVTGVDDVKYAHLLAVPLTTIRQPCAAIGQAAVEAMLQRIALPGRPGREILLDADLVTRASTA
ncbi:MAG TPA: GntR family transcriptional regulator [Armatimonadota bacterium]|jgi:DNA-binding LacI/PurR family transcriptional regulator